VLESSFSVSFCHSDADGGGISIVREQDLSCERLGQARGTRHIAVYNEHVPCELLALEDKVPLAAVSVALHKRRIARTVCGVRVRFRILAPTGSTP
jgi:hypothetical protein